MPLSKTRMIGVAPALDLGRVMTWLRERLPDDAIVTSDAGNFSGWPNRFLQYRRPGRQLGPTSGAMGYGVPAAVAAKLACPERRVVGVCGDGGFLMTGQEVETAVRLRLPITILVMRNGLYGTIAMHQLRAFGRTSGVDIGTVDLASFARSLGATGYRAATTADLTAALIEAEDCAGPVVIDVLVDPDRITPDTTLSALRDAASP